MLSYQHAYHAGNFSDVLKHTVLCSVIDYMKQKDKPFYFHDTHAGRGLYPFTLAEMQKLREHEQGISKLWPLLLAAEKSPAKNLPAGLVPYTTALRSYNTNDNITRYPGSGLLAHALMRVDDHLMLTELHPGEFASLQENTRKLGNVTTQKIDAWVALRAALPPKQKRGVILIDPSYEVKNEHRQVIDALEESLKRFSTGIYMIWYPIIANDNLFKKMIRGVEQLAPPSLLRIELYVAQPANNENDEKTGLIGSGMLVINAPWQLDSAMKEALPVLHKALVQEASPRKASDDYRVQWMIEKK